MNWDSKGAIKSLEAKKCIMCKEKKSIYVVATLHGEKDLHFPCCSEKCLEDFQDTLFGSFV